MFPLDALEICDNVKKFDINIELSLEIKVITFSTTLQIANILE